MPDDQYEPNRFLGFPVSSRPRARRDGEPQPRQGEEPQRVMGFPVDRLGEWFGPADGDWLGSLAHPVRGYRRWLRRRRLGPYAVDDDEPGRRPGA